MKTCEECKAALHAYLDGALSPAEARMVEKHIEGCASCAQEKEDMLLLLREMREMREVAVPQEAHDAWVNALRDERKKARPKRGPMRAVRYMGYAAAAVVLLLVGVSLGGSGEFDGLGGEEFPAEEQYDRGDLVLFAESAPVEGGAVMPSGSTRGFVDQEALTVDDLESAEYDAPEVSLDGGGGSNGAESGNTEQKLVREVQIYFTCLEYDKAVEMLRKHLGTADGYIEYSYDRGSSEGFSRKSEYSLRIPASALDGFLENVRGIGKVTEETQNSYDESANYTDAETRVNTLRKQYARLEELMGTATRMEDILSIEEKLTSVLYEIESLEGQLQYIDNRVRYSSVHVSLAEQAPEREIIQTTEVSLPERVSIAFFAAINSLKNSAETLLLFAVRNMFHIIIGVVMILIAIAILRGVYKKIKGDRL